MFGLLGLPLTAIDAATGGAMTSAIDYGVDKAKDAAINYGLKTIGVNVGTKRK